MVNMLVSGVSEGSQHSANIIKCASDVIGAAWVSAPSTRLIDADAHSAAEAPAELESDWQVNGSK